MHDSCRESTSAEPLMTIREMHRLRNELDILIHERRTEITLQIEYARQFGDLSENQEYTSARELQSENERDIEQLKRRIAESRLILPGMPVTTDEHRRLKERLDACRAHLDMLYDELRTVRRRQPSPRRSLFEELLRGAMDNDRAELSSLRVILDTVSIIDDKPRR